MVGDELLMGRFRVVERIGSGGMGTVFRAYDERLQRHVAVKEVEAEPGRVLREAQAAARLNHPAIVTLYELGERDGRALLVSELVRGPTLADLHAEGMLSDRDVAELGSDLCEALEHAHSRGVVHRDVKPQNVIVAGDRLTGRRAKLLDFGIARIAGAPTLTAAGEVVGTLAYMSAEQADGEVAGPESDVYSLALMLYECWAGANPVAAATPAESARRIGTRLPPLRSRRPDLPQGLCGLIDAALDPDPAMRPLPAELGEYLDYEATELDAISPVPLPGDERPEAAGVAWARVGALAAVAAALTALAGPLGRPGLALVLLALALPGVLAGAPAAALAQPFVPLLAGAGLGPGAAAAGAPARGWAARALLGAGAWLWLAAGSLILGLGPDLGLGPEPAAGWETHPRIAAEAVLVPLAAPESLAGLGLFALAACVLGWLLTLHHLALAFVGAMLWAAALDAALAAAGIESLAGEPLAIATAAALAVGFEFGLLQARAAASGRGPATPARLRLAPVGRVANPPSGL